jgi:hypothetical protein
LLIIAFWHSTCANDRLLNVQQTNAKTKMTRANLGIFSQPSLFEVSAQMQSTENKINLEDLLDIEPTHLRF